MTITPAELWAETQVTASATVFFTSPANGNGALIKRAVFTNTDSVARTITVYKVPSAGSPGATNILLGNYSIAAGEAYVPQSIINMVLPPGATIQALASSASVVNTTGSGFLF